MRGDPLDRFFDRELHVGVGTEGEFHRVQARSRRRVLESLIVNARSLRVYTRSRRTCAIANRYDAPPCRNEQPRIPLAVKIVYTIFVAVLVPKYWIDYGPTNFLYFCDIALLMTVAAVWTESPLLASMPAVGIVFPQIIWIVDFLLAFAGLAEYHGDRLHVRREHSALHSRLVVVPLLAAVLAALSRLEARLRSPRVDVLDRTGVDRVARVVLLDAAAPRTGRQPEPAGEHQLRARLQRRPSRKRGCRRWPISR